MTMFTPAGDGGRRSAGRSGKRSSTRRTAITLLVAVLLLAGAVGVAWEYLLNEEEGVATANSACAAAPTVAAAPPAAAVAPAKTNLNVYNATSRSGLAGNVAAELRKRKFVVRKIANDPLNRKVSATAEVRYGRGNDGRARTVAAQVAGAQLVLDKRRNKTVDLVVGEKFAKLATPRQAAAALAPKAAASPASTC